MFLRQFHSKYTSWNGASEEVNEKTKETQNRATKGRTKERNVDSFYARAKQTFKICV